MNNADWPSRLRCMGSRCKPLLPQVEEKRSALNVSCGGPGWNYVRDLAVCALPPSWCFVQVHVIASYLLLHNIYKSDQTHVF